MSTEALRDSFLSEGAPELTALGKRLEILRIERGISKQHLARFAGTSRQQLWRVMTGKSELTDALRQRLAVALQVDSAALTTASISAASSTRPTAASDSATDSAVATRAIGISLDTYLCTPQLAER